MATKTTRRTAYLGTSLWNWNSDADCVVWNSDKDCVVWHRPVQLKLLFSPSCIWNDQDCKDQNGLMWLAKTAHLNAGTCKCYIALKSFAYLHMIGAVRSNAGSWDWYCISAPCILEVDENSTVEQRLVRLILPLNPFCISKFRKDHSEAHACDTDIPPLNRDRRSRAVIGGSNVSGSGPVAPVKARAGGGEDASCPETWTIRKLKGVLSLAGVPHTHCLTRWNVRSIFSSHMNRIQIKTCLLLGCLLHAAWQGKFILFIICMQFGRKVGAAGQLSHIVGRAVFALLFCYLVVMVDSRRLLVMVDSRRLPVHRHWAHLQWKWVCRLP